MASSFTTSEFQMKPTTGRHRVKIHKSLTDGIESGRSIRCGTFTVGEYQWAILYYPNGQAELFGSMRESTARCIKIEDMEPQIFKALLQFIYTDKFPASKGVDEDVFYAQHLTVAADKYGLDRLKLICEERLANQISADNVVTTLALAARHNCQQLKEINMS